MEKEVSEADKKLLIRKNYLQKIDDELAKEFLDSADLYALIKGFFTEFLKLDYEFANEELSVEITKAFIRPATKERIDSMLSKLSEISYFRNTELTQEELRAFFIELRSIIDESIPAVHHSESHSLLQKLFGKDASADLNVAPAPVPVSPSLPIHSPSPSDVTLPAAQSAVGSAPESAPLFSQTSFAPQTPQTPQPALEVSLPPLQPVLSPQGTASLITTDQHAVPINEHLEEAYMQLSQGNMMQAKLAYIDALSLYHQMPKEEKQLHYFDLYEVFTRISTHDDSR